MTRLQKQHEIFAFVLSVVLGLPPAIATASWYLPLGAGDFSYEYAGVPFAAWGVALGTRHIPEYQDENGQTVAAEFIPSATQDLSSYGRARAIHVVQACAFSTNVPDNEVVGQVNVFYTDGSFSTVDLIMGVNTAEWAWEHANLYGSYCLQHGSVEPALSTDSGEEGWRARAYHAWMSLEDKDLAYLELALDENSYSHEEWQFGCCGWDWFDITISAVTLEYGPQGSAPDVTVSAKACIHFAGQDGVPDMGYNETSDSVPPWIGVCGGGTLSITAEGTWGHPTLSGPDGYGWIADTEQPYVDLGGITQVSGAAINTLVGVFLTDDPPSLAAMPDPLGSGDDMTIPKIQQAFAIGSGLDDIQIPVEATRLFLAMKDGWEWSNNIGEVYVHVTMQCDGQGPVTSDVSAAPNPVPANGSVVVTAHVDDSLAGGSPILSAECGLAGAWYSMTAQDGTFDEVGEDVTVTVAAPAESGLYDLCVEGTDAAMNGGEPACTLLVVYDPAAGFVTGGGWIESPAGAYAADPDLTGKAMFGFVAKYIKGATVPTGNTEFQFSAGSLNFHSSLYEWLVVTGSNYAKFKGRGAINGSGDYKFQVWAGDGPDTFRIRIWEEDETTGEETDVYDNGFDQGIGGGSIVIHTK